MPTIKTILEEIKNVPVEHLEDLYSIIHSLKSDTKAADKTNHKILSFAGSFSDMSKKDYNEFVQESRNVRDNLFDRDNNI